MCVYDDDKIKANPLTTKTYTQIAIFYTSIYI